MDERVERELNEKLDQLITLYPNHEKPIYKGLNYHRDNRAWVNELLAGSSGDGTFAHVSSEEYGNPGYLVRKSPTNSYFCECKSSQYNRIQTVLADGSIQFPCCHVWALVFTLEEMYRQFTAPVPDPV